MKRALVTSLIVILAACATHTPVEFPSGIEPTSTAPLSKAEASYYAAPMAVASGEDKSCLIEELIRKSELDFFATYVENHIKCGGYENPRAEVISQIQESTIRICSGAPVIPVRIRTCWDGSFYDHYDPCFVCPPEPKE